MSETETRFSLDLEKITPHELAKVTRRLGQAAQAPPLLSQAFFSHLIAVWDSFFSSIVTELLECHPEVMDRSKRPLTFADVKSVNSIQQVRDLLLTEQVDQLMRGSHEAQFAYLEEKFGIKVSRDDLWRAFIEVTERRNLVVHTDLRVSRQYLRVCRKHDLALDAELGQVLPIGHEYFSHACDTLTELGIKLGYSVWRTTQKKLFSQQDAHFLQVTCSLIEDGLYDLARRLLECSLGTEGYHSSGDNRTRCVLNLAQCHKWLGSQGDCLKVLEQEDWSGLSDEFTLQYLVLRDEFDEASNLLVQMIRAGAVDRDAIESWPIFQRFRYSEPFRRAQATSSGL